MGMVAAANAVVVGVDGSDESVRGLRWAVYEADMRSAPLLVVHAADLGGSRLFTADDPELVAARRAAESLVDAAERQARALAPDLEVRSVLEVGEPPTVLLAYTPQAAMVVLGSRGIGGFTGVLLGSTSLQVAMHAVCPVVVLRPGDVVDVAGVSAGRIVVGSDGSPHSAHALAFAFERAQDRGLAVTAIRAWHWPGQVEREAQERLSKDLAPWRAQYPEVDVRERAVPGNAAKVLIDESAGAEILVVGSHGRGGFEGLVLGSVSHAAIQHAYCPVAVVRK